MLEEFASSPFDYVSITAEECPNEPRQCKKSSTLHELENRNDAAIFC